MATTIARLTYDDLLRLPNGDRMEKIEGVPLPMTPPSLDHGDDAGSSIQRIRNHTGASKLGGIVGPETSFGFGSADEPDTVLLPDVAYIREERLPPKEERGAAVCREAPDLAVELLSPSSTALEIEATVAIYLGGGTRLVSVFNPVRRTVTVHLPDRTARTLVDGDILDGGDVLPGFTLPVREAF